MPGLIFPNTNLPILPFQGPLDLSSLFLDGKVLKGSDVLEGDFDLPDYLVINPEKMNGCS